MLRIACPPDRDLTPRGTSLVTFDLAVRAASNIMPNQDGGEVTTLATQLDSNLESVDQAEDAVLRVAQELGLPEEDLHKIGMAVRESMVNAVVHGNRYNARKKVHLSVSKGRGQMTITVRDEGEGFEHKEVPDPLSEENLLRQSGRGLLLIKAFVDELHIHHAQPAGTEVKLVKYLGKSN